jgi:hypothetical protein
MKLRDRRTVFFNDTATSALYTLTAGGSLTSTDAVVAFDLTRSIVEDHSIALSSNLLGLEENRGPDGRFYSQQGIGHSIYNVPFYLAGTVAQRLIDRRIGKPDTLPKAAVALGSAVAGAMAVLLVWLLSRKLGAGSRAALVAAASAAVASPLWPYSKFGFSTALTVAILLGSACLLLDAAERESLVSAAAAGLVVGFGWLTRHEMALVLLPFAVFLVLAARDRIRGWSQACILTACACVGGLLWVWYNAARFGRPFYVGYSPAFDLSGYGAFLVSPGGSILLYAPIAVGWAAGLFLSPGLSSAARALLAGPLAVFFLFYGSLANWVGGRSYGPRYLVPALILLSPGAAMLWARGGWRRPAIVTAIAIGAVLQLHGVLVDYSKVSVDWARTAAKADVEQRNWRTASSPLVLDARAAVRAVPANLSYVSGRQPVPRVDTTAAAENRDFAQQLSFSLDFWWLYLFYLHAISARAALLMAALLTIVAMACAMLAWTQTARAD